MAKVDPRLMIAVGFVGFAIGTWQASFITADWDFWELLVPQMFRGFSLMLCMVPINNLALGTMPPDRIKNASGLFNLMRNLGGAFGLALINTMLDKRMDLHLERLREAVVWGRSAADETLAGDDRGAGGARLRRRARGDARDGADGAPAGRSAGARRRFSRADRWSFSRLVGLAAFMRRPQQWRRVAAAAIDQSAANSFGRPLRARAPSRPYYALSAARRPGAGPLALRRDER